MKMESEIGTISKWNDEKGFGFITPNSGGKQIFIHINEFSREHKRPMQGIAVKYNQSTDASGRSCAVDVSPLKGHKKFSRADRQLLFSILFSSTFFAILGILVAMNELPIVILGAYLILSAAAFALYKKDKSAAEWDEWRTAENTLHMISTLGGWPGALVAQNKLRHKSSKLSFRVVYWATVVINCAALSWLLSPDGASMLTMIKNLKIG
jgi:uncharacterized membrane protein YsdA (DUF1294 family)/cold shock CspA family protein